MELRVEIADSESIELRGSEFTMSKGIRRVKKAD